MRPCPIDSLCQNLNLEAAMNASNPAPSPIDLEVLLALTEGD
jgi:hypothetical protein